MLDKSAAVKEKGGLATIDEYMQNLPELLQRNREILDEVRVCFISAILELSRMELSKCRLLIWHKEFCPISAVSPAFTWQQLSRQYCLFTVCHQGFVSLYFDFRYQEKKNALMIQEKPLFENRFDTAVNAW